LSLSQETERFFHGISEKSNAVSLGIRGIADMNQELSCEIRKINERLDRIAIVVQANASGAQESSALSHEMSGTASMLRAQTELFRL
ncbi:MAG: hypothetical protein LBC65_05165, partial [Oscillospiraceae bacterium]|nr:hypothetical protein [Oscillospiraceae bacterium]